MKKLFKILFLILTLTIVNEVKAITNITFDDNSPILKIYDSNYIYGDFGQTNNYYLSSAKNLGFNIMVTGQRTTWIKKGKEIIVEDTKPETIEINITSSSDINCTVNNARSDIYSLGGGTFNIVNTGAILSETKIGTIVCSLPNTDNLIKLSSDNWLNILMTSHNKNYVNGESSTETVSYRFNFGIINNNYLQGLNDNKLINNLIIDDNPEYNNEKNIETNKSSIKINLDNPTNDQIILKLYDENNKEVLNTELTDNEKKIDIPYGKSKLKVLEITEKSAFVNSLGEINYYYGFTSNDFNHNSYEEIYNINRLDNRSKVNTLKSLTVSDTQIAFKDGSTSYSATVPYKVSSIKIDSTLTDDKSSYVTGYGNRTISLNPGENEILIKVKAENDDVRTYSIHITREKNDDASLSKLIINDKEILIKEDIMDYSIILANDITKAIIKATPTDEDAKVEISEIEDLKEGSNKVTITVTAANDNKKVYTIDIIRDELISINSKLKDLIIENYPIDFDRDTYNYTVTINKNTKNLIISAIPENMKATYQIIGNGKLKNKSVITIEVTAEDKKTKSIYKINVIKESFKINPFLVISIILIALIGLISITTIQKKQKVWK